MIVSRFLQRIAKLVSGTPLVGEGSEGPGDLVEFGNLLDFCPEAFYQCTIELVTSIRRNPLPSPFRHFRPSEKLRWYAY